MPPDDLLTIPATAVRLGLHVSRVRRLCQEGRLPGAVHSDPGHPRRGTWTIPPEALAVYRAAERGKTLAGRPAKARAQVACSGCGELCYPEGVGGSPPGPLCGECF